MPETDTLLLEIGYEELPSSFVDAALAPLPTLVRERLAALRLPHGELRALGTPRRLAVVVPELALAQAESAGDLIETSRAAAARSEE